MSMAAADLDTVDPLTGFRSRFAFPDPELVYLDGNSLGRLPLAAAERAAEIVEHEWGERLIRSWNDSWWEAPLRIGDKLAALIGARADEVVLADSTSVNLFKLLAGAVALTPRRSRILTDDLNFPSDMYVAGGVSRMFGPDHRVEHVPSRDGIHGPANEIMEALDDDVAVLTLSHVAFKSGYLYDMAELTAAAHEVGALVLWDLSHSAGVVPIDLERWDVDMAVGCTYKYLNGGPGAPAFLYVRKDLQAELSHPIPGWWGHANPFEFAPDFRASAGMRRYLTGTAPILSTLLVEVGVDIVSEAGVAAIRDKSERQTAYLAERWEQDLKRLGFTLKTPTDPVRRGSHVSLGHPAGLGIDLALINDHGVLPDFRPPDSIRLGLAPLYTRYVDIERAVDALAEIVTAGTHHRFAASRPQVT